MDKIYTSEEVLKMLNITKQTLYLYIKRGELKAFKLGKYWRVYEQDLLSFIESKRP